MITGMCAGYSGNRSFPNTILAIRNFQNRTFDDGRGHSATVGHRNERSEDVRKRSEDVREHSEDVRKRSETFGRRSETFGIVRKHVFKENCVLIENFKKIVYY